MDNRFKGFFLDPDGVKRSIWMRWFGRKMSNKELEELSKTPFTTNPHQDKE